MKETQKKDLGKLVATLVVSAAWLFGIVLCFALVEKFENTSGRALAKHTSGPPEQWPVGSAIPFKGPTLLMFVHPKCPCTRASLAELSSIAPKLKGINTYLVELSPEATSVGEKSRKDAAPAQSAGNGSNILSYIDEAGWEAATFGATTSGETLFYRADGKLLFSGGITRARGLEGDNPYLEKLSAAIRGDKTSCSTPVYGCALADNPAPLSEVVEAWSR